MRLIRNVDVEKVLRLAESLGASEAEVYFVKGRDVKVSATDRIRHCEVLELGAVGIRVAVGRRVAVVGTQRIDEAGIKEVVESAVSIARAGREDPDWRGFNERLGTRELRGLWDKDTANASPEDVAGVVKESLEKLSSMSPVVKPVECVALTSSATIELINSYGGPLTQRLTSSSMYILAKALSGGVEGTFIDDEFSRSLKGLRNVELAERVGVKAREYINSSPVETGDYDVILSPKVMASLLSVMLSGPLSALSVQQGRSPLAGKVGEAVMAESITIVDDGINPSLPGCRSFDDEGHPTTRRALISKGILLDYVYDTYTAKREGRESTGNAWRPSYSSNVTPMPNHLRLEPGDSGIDEMIEEVKRGLLVEATIGEWLSNPVSGQLNATVTHAKLVVNGDVVKPVKGVVLSGNFYELMMRNVELIGREAEVSIHGRSSAPPVLIKGVKVAGK